MTSETDAHSARLVTCINAPVAFPLRNGLPTQLEETMRHLRTLVAVPALAVAFAFAAPAFAQTPAELQAAGGGAGAAQGSNHRMISARNLMTPEERASFRGQMLQATPQEQQRLWAQKRTELQERASMRGMALAEPGARMGQGFGENEGFGAGRGFGRAERSPMLGRMMGGAPRGL
jgi:hypothetical protein